MPNCRNNRKFSYIHSLLHPYHPSARQPAAAMWYDRPAAVFVEFIVEDSKDVLVKFDKCKFDFRWVVVLRDGPESSFKERFFHHVFLIHCVMKREWVKSKCYCALYWVVGFKCDDLYFLTAVSAGRTRSWRTQWTCLERLTPRYVFRFYVFSAVKKKERNILTWVVMQPSVIPCRNPITNTQ